MDGELATEETTVALWRIGRYSLGDQIGSGGMGVVHRAIDADGRVVAIKLLRPHVAGDAESRERFAREVRVLSRVRGHHIAEVQDADVAAETPYLVTRYIDGASLHDVVQRDGPLRGTALESLAADLADALVSIHRVGVVHRDLKPGNVLVCDGEAVVIDFGIAQVVDETRMTVPGMVFGTPGYLAPELLSGGAVSSAVDVHSWGATVAYAATGRQPFGRGRFDVVSYRVVHEPPDLSGVPAWLEPVLAHCLSKDPAARPSARELYDWLADQDLQDRTGDVATVPPAAGAGGVAGVAAGAGAAGAALAAADQPYDQADEPFDWANDAADDWSTTRSPASFAEPQDAAANQVRPSAEPTPADQWETATLRPAEPAPARPTAAPHAMAPHTMAPHAMTPQQWAPPQHEGGGSPAYDETRVDDGASAPPGPYGPDQQWTGAAVRPPVRDRVAVVMLSLTLAAAAAVAPVLAAAWLLWWLVFARTVDRSGMFLERRRAARGPRRTDSLAATGALPWHLVRSLVVTVLFLVVAVICGGAVISLGVLVGGAAGQDAPVELVAGIGVVLTIAAAWWGPGGTAVRQGSYRTWAALLRPSWASGVLAIVIAGALTTLLVLGWLSPMSLWPLQEVADVPATVQEMIPGLDR